MGGLHVETEEPASLVVVVAVSGMLIVAPASEVPKVLEIVVVAIVVAVVAVVVVAAVVGSVVVVVVIVVVVIDVGAST